MIAAVGLVLLAAGFVVFRAAVTGRPVADVFRTAFDAKAVGTVQR